ncbi:hypothetical protein DFH27DRAFT_580189 [Peziza echinospora]|nr:hypothetical protein DFH27DRAFT_580189 [Peziza echinospora]
MPFNSWNKFRPLMALASVIASSGANQLSKTKTKVRETFNYRKSYRRRDRASKDGQVESDQIRPEQDEMHRDFVVLEPLTAWDEATLTTSNTESYVKVTGDQVPALLHDRIVRDSVMQDNFEHDRMIQDRMIQKEQVAVAEILLEDESKDEISEVVGSSKLPSTTPAAASDVTCEICRDIASPQHILGLENIDNHPRPTTVSVFGLDIPIASAPVIGTPGDLSELQASFAAARLRSQAESQLPGGFTAHNPKPRRARKGRSSRRRSLAKQEYIPEPDEQLINIQIPPTQRTAQMDTTKHWVMICQCDCHVNLTGRALARQSVVDCECFASHQ